MHACAWGGSAFHAGSRGSQLCAVGRITCDAPTKKDYESTHGAINWNGPQYTLHCRRHTLCTSRGVRGERTRFGQPANGRPTLFGGRADASQPARASTSVSAVHFVVPATIPFSRLRMLRRMHVT